ncbi:MAG: GIY-YIG nuclease family protein [Dehalococcoidia bacterium]
MLSVAKHLSVPSILTNRKDKDDGAHPPLLRVHHGQRSEDDYTGVTNNLERRVFEHKTKLHDGFTNKFNITRLVYMETTTDISEAIQRETQIKGWLRSKKVALIESDNPQWQDLADGWYEEPKDSSRRSE